MGRDSELERLASLIAAGRSVVIAGPTGIGKSRLARELLKRAGDIIGDVVRVTATRSAAEIPFGAIAALVPATASADVSFVDTRAERIEQCVSALTAAQDGPRALLIDDLQLLDAASATVVHRAVAIGACRLVGTLRSDEPTPDAVVALWKEDLVLRHELGVLDSHEAERLLQVALGHPVESAAAAKFVGRSQGNILLLRELVRGAQDAGTLVLDAHLWRLTGPLRLSQRLVESVEARLSNLTPGDRDILEFVAMGEPLGAAMLTSKFGTDAVEEMERRGLLSARRDGRRLYVGLTHPIYGEVLLARVPELRLRRIARELARALDVTGARRREDTLRLATWWLDGGGGDRPELMLRAATIARWDYDFPLAERCVRAAVEEGAGFEAALLAGQLAFLQGRGDEAEAALAEVAILAEDDDQRTRVALARLACAIFLGHAPSALAIAQAAEAEITSVDLRNEITARRSGVLFATSGPRAAVQVAAPLLERSRGNGLAYAALVACLGYGRLGRLEDALKAADLGAAAAGPSPAALDSYPWLQTFFRGDALLYGGEFKHVEVVAREQFELAVAEHSTERQAYFGFQLAKAVGERGDVDDAINRAREAAALFRELNRPILLEPCLVDVIVGYALSGQRDEAAATLAALERLELTPSYYPVEVLRARAWVAIADGRLADARALLAQGAELGERIGDLVGALDAVHLLARLGGARAVHGDAERIGSEMSGALAEARVRHISALATDDVAALQTVSLTFEEMGADLLAAEAAADASLAAGRTGETTQRIAVLRRRAAALRERVPGVSTPALLATGRRAELSSAETDAAFLAVAGYSNRAIAARLYLSVRTVEGQLQRCYEKLHVTGRDELAAVLRGHEPDADR
jgi:DNA-binding CsgD family transcriptional regulator